MIGITNSRITVDEINHTNQPVLFFWGRQSAGSSNPPSSSLRYTCNGDYFSYDTSTRKFTSKKAFTGKLYAWGLSSRNSGGTACTLTWSVYKNSTKALTGNGTVYSHSSGSGTAVTFAVDDIVYICGAHSIGGTCQTCMGFLITRDS